MAEAPATHGPEGSHQEPANASNRNQNPVSYSRADYLYRPTIHFSPQVGFMNDPNGLIFDGTYYHLFYQYDPIAPYAGHVHWGHARSKDLYHWEDCPTALAPNAAGEAFTGCAVFDRKNTSGLFGGTPGNAPNFALIYTRATEASQSQYLAISQDNGITFQEVAKPILDISSKSFRDPKVFYHEPSQRWIMTVVQSRLHKVSFYGSYDLKNWMHLSDFGSAGLFGVDYECPNLIEVPLEGTTETRWLMLVSINPGAPLGGSISQYFVGFFDGERFTSEDQHTVYGLTDFCKDSYALQTYENLPIKDATLIAWLGNWQYCEEVPNEGWRGIMTVPRRIAVRRGADGWIRLVQHPVGLEALRGPQLPNQIGYIPALTQHTIPIPIKTAIELSVTVAMDSRPTNVPDGDRGRAGRFMISLANEQGETLTIGFEAFSSQLWIDRGGLAGFSNPFFTKQFSTALTPDVREFSLRFVFDGSAFEVFVNDGVAVGTLLVFPQNPLDRVTLATTNTGAHVKNLALWPLAKTMPRDAAEKI